MEAKWLNIDEFAAMVGLAPKTIRDMVTRGEIPHRRIGRDKVRGPVRFTPEDVRAYGEQCYRPAITATPSRTAARTRQAARTPRQRTAA